MVMKNTASPVSAKQRNKPLPKGSLPHDEDWDRLTADQRRERENFRNERSPAELEAEEADEGAAPDNLLPGQTPSGWTTRNT